VPGQSDGMVLGWRLRRTRVRVCRVLKHEEVLHSDLKSEVVLWVICFRFRFKVCNIEIKNEKMGYRGLPQ
jgi:hypothetical protein